MTTPHLLPIRVSDRYEILSAVGGLGKEPVLIHRPVRRAAWTERWSHLAAAAASERAERGNPLIVDEEGHLPELYRLAAWSVDCNQALHLSTDITDYAEYLVTSGPDWQSIPSAVRSNALGVSAVVVSSDGLTLLGQRSGAKEERTSLWHVIPSGHAHPQQSLLDGVMSELCSELGVGREHVVSWASTGLLRDLRNGKPEVTFSLISDLLSSELLQRRAHSEERWEFTRTRCVAWEAGSIGSLLRTELNHFESPGHGAMLLCGVRDFGSAWAEAVVDHLREAAPT